MARSIRAVKTAFPDWHVSIDALVADGEMVVDRFTISATHTGSVNGIAPTGHKIDTLGMHMWRVTNGKLVEGWYLTDAMPTLAAALVPSP
jgi:predicted ester cyclase